MKYASLISTLACLLIVACATPTTVPARPTSNLQAPTSNTQSQTSNLSITIGAPTGTLLKPLLGINIGPTPAGEAGNADLTKAYKQIGVNLIRTHDFYGPLDMAQMYPDRTRDPSKPESYNLKSSDEKWKSIVDGGFEPYFRLGDSWNNATPPANAQERANWVKAAAEVMRHYREGKWNGFKTQFRFVEIWNEPDNTQFWQKPHTREEYFQLYVETAITLKQSFPDLQIGGPGLTPAGALSPQGQQYTQAFLDDVKRNNAPLDFFSWHIYSNDPNAYVTAAQFYRAQLDAHGFKNTASHITEWNTDIKPPRASTDEATQLRVGGRGAAILTAAWIGLQQNNVDISTLYRGPDPAMKAPSFYGIFFANGTPKRNALAFLLWKQLVEHPKRLTLIASPNNNAVWMLSGQNGVGETAILLANPTNQAFTWTLGGIDVRSISIQQINDTNELIQRIQPSSAVVETTAYAVQLITIGK